MADSKISQLTDLALPATGEEEVPLAVEVSANSYVAKGVHFGGDNSLSIASLTTPDPTYTKFSFAAWFRTGEFPPVFFAVDPENEYSTWMGTQSDFYFQGGAESADDSFFLGMKMGAGSSYDRANINKNRWWLLLFTADTTAGEYVAYLCSPGLPDRRIDTPPNNPDTNFVMTFNGLSFWISDDSYGDTEPTDWCDIRIMPGVDLRTAGDITEATRRFFVDDFGKPVDPAVARAEFGPFVAEFTGDHTAFATNIGTGGAFTLNGSALTDAVTSP